MNDKLQKIDGGVLYLKDNPIQVNDIVCIVDPLKNTRCFKVTKLSDERKARGVWNKFPEWPTFCKIDATLVGYYNPTTKEVEISPLP